MRHYKYGFCRTFIKLKYHIVHTHSVFNMVTNLEIKTFCMDLDFKSYVDPKYFDPIF